MKKKKRKNITGTGTKEWNKIILTNVTTSVNVEVQLVLTLKAVSVVRDGSHTGKKGKLEP